MTRSSRWCLRTALAKCVLFMVLMQPDEVRCAGDIWPLERPDTMPSIQSLEVMCGKDHMDVHLTFSQPFEGIVSSKGQHADPRCVYVPPSTGQTFFSFRIAYARCGTKPDLNGQFYENTVVVQYDKDLLEVWDEAKRLRCEWFNDYEKTASKPPMVIADLDIIQLDFRGDNVDCWMEIQHGKGPWAPPVSGIVPLGSTLSLVVAINDYRGEFDMRVKSCVASDGAGHVIHLSDEAGCVLRPKMISRFLKTRASDDRASVITYAFFHAFKFPDALSVHIKCKVEICRHGCPDHCQLSGHGGAQERKDSPQTVAAGDAEMLYDDILHDGSENGASAGYLRDPLVNNSPDLSESEEVSSSFEDHDDLENSQSIDDNGQEGFPHGPRLLENAATGNPRPMQAVAGPRSLDPDRSARRRRTATVSDRKARSADVGVSGLYDVISEADLAFSPDGRQEAVTVFQGRIREEVVYGICLPVPGFSALFVLLATAAAVSALVAGSLLYRYQLQRDQLARHKGQRLPTSNLASWMAMRLMRPAPVVSRAPPAGAD